jgi:MOSC domain-containing protein YiiM
LDAVAVAPAVRAVKGRPASWSVLECVTREGAPKRFRRTTSRRGTVLVVSEHLPPRTANELLTGLDEIRRAPRDTGSVLAIVRRPAVDKRELAVEAEVDVDEGVVGDTWRARGNRHTSNGAADPLAQVTIMNARFARLIAGEEHERWAQAGDQLYVDLDLSIEHLPPGTRLTIGDAELEVSDKPHTGCEKFAARFGVEALRFVGSPEGRALRLRGVNTRVLTSGAVHVGDGIRVALMEPDSAAG